MAFPRFLDEVQSHCNENKMSVQNLATVFGPNILRPKMEDPVTIMEGAGSLVEGVIVHNKGIWSKSNLCL